jgi:inorganic triphosphatase YgiF
VPEDADREVELALLVRGESPLESLDRIASLERLAGRRLEPLPEQELRDTYLDTQARELGSRRIALRLRHVGGVSFLTLKVPQGEAQGGTDRVEIERPWSREAWDTIAAELARVGVEVSAHGAAHDDPLETARTAGLWPVQRRRTQRRRRDVETLAELAVDSVLYELGRGGARIGQVELEARSADADLAELAGALLVLFPELVPWPHGKLATGFALAAAIEDGTVTPGPDGWVPPSGLDALACRLA